MDEKPDEGLRNLHVVELKNGTASELLPKVKQIYDEQSKDKTLKPATIYTDATGARLLVQGTQDQAAAIQQIVETLDSVAPAARESEVFDLGKLAEAQRVLPLAQKLYKDQLANSPQPSPPDAQILSDNKTGRLYVSARADQLKIIKDVIGRLTVSANLPGRETARLGRRQPFRRAAGVALGSTALSGPMERQTGDGPRGRAVHRRPEDRPFDNQRQTRAPGPNRGHPEEAWDREPPRRNRSTRILDLTTASAVELAATVRTLYLEEAKGRLGNQAPDTLITPDAGGNRLIVVGDTNEITAVEEIVRKLDKVSAASASARVFKIKSADPDKVAEILTASLVHYDAYGRPQKRATVSADPKTRTIIVTGDPKELQGVSLIIEQLDQSLGDQPERKMKVVTLKQGKVATLAAQARQIYNDRIKSKPDLGTSELLMLEENASNQLILAGNEGQLEVAEQIIEELQTAQIARSARETKLLDAGTAEEMTRLLPLVQQLYRDRMRGRDASDPPDAQIMPDEKNGRFIVTARTNHIAEIEGILAQLRAGQLGPEAHDTRVYELTTATASDLSATVRTLYQEQAKNRPGSARPIPSSCRIAAPIGSS